MKKKSILYGFLSLVLALLVIEGSTGVTTVLHHCSSHGESMLVTGILPSAGTEADCCHHTDTEKHTASDCCGHNASGNTSSNETTLNNHCCNYEFSNLKITSYLPTLKFEVAKISQLNSFISENLILEEYPLPVYDAYSLSKPGGRDIINSICTLIS